MSFICKLLIWCVLSVLVVGGARAHDIPGLPPEMQVWAQSVDVTPAAQARLPWKKCCNHAEIVRTKFRVNKVNGADEWYYEWHGGWKHIPSDIVHWGEHAPDGQPTLFIYLGTETCFFPPEEGI